MKQIVMGLLLTGLLTIQAAEPAKNPVVAQKAEKTAAQKQGPMRVIEGKFLNPKFDKELSQWYLGVDRKVSQVSFQQENGNGFMHIEIGKPGFKHYMGVNTTMLDDVAALQKKLQNGEFLKIRVRARLRYKNLGKPGIALTADLLLPGQNQRFAWRETGYMNGNSDWKTVEICSAIPEQTGKIRVAVNFAPGTTGTIDIDDVSVKLEVWPKGR